MNIFTHFKKVTGYDLVRYYDEFDNFMSRDFDELVSYYRGNSEVRKGVFSRLSELIQQSNTVSELVSSNKHQLSFNTEFWDLAINLEDISNKLLMCKNLAKWMRSSYVFGYENKSKKLRILKQRQTIENLSQEIGSSDPNEDWVELAYNNSLYESMYDFEGGNELTVNTPDLVNNELTTTIDIMVGDNILGKDIDTLVQFIDDDLLVHNPKDTMLQSASICLLVTKGGVPELPFLGISKSLVGANIATYRAQSLLREVVNNFRTDDAFKKVELLESKVVGDVSFYEFKIVSRLNTEFNIIHNA